MTTALLAEALYEHWCSSSYELNREPAFADAAPNLKRVFTDQAAALEQVIETIMRQTVSDAFIAAAGGARFRGDIGKEAADYLELCAQYALVDDCDDDAQVSEPGRSAMEAAEADCDALAPARAEMLNYLQERYVVSGKATK